MDQILSNIDNTLGGILQTFIEKPTIIKGVLHLFLILYAARLAPVPPKQVLMLFDNVYFKLVCFSLILYTAQFSPSTSILIALAFMVTINYTTTGKMWEMMENTTPMAQSKDQAMSTMISTMNNQVSNTPIVGSIAQNPNTIVITPSIVQTSNGPAVINPTVVVAPATVSTPSGQVVTITPEITTMTAPMATPMVAPMDASMAASMTAPMAATVSQSIEAVKILSQAAMSPAASDSQSVVSIANIAVANISTTDGAQAIDNLVKQSIIAESGEPSKVKNAVNIAIGSMTDATDKSSDKQGGCFPTRQYDMSKVTPQTDGVTTFEDYQPWSPMK